MKLDAVYEVLSNARRLDLRDNLRAHMEHLAKTIEVLLQAEEAAEARGYARAREQAARMVEAGTAKDSRSRHSRRIRAMKDEGGEDVAAPPVFTLEEVEQALRREELGPATARRVREVLATLRT